MLTIRCLTPLRRTVLCLTLLKHNYILPHSCTTVLCLTLLKRIVLRWAAYCCRLPVVPATSSPHAESHKPRFPQISQPHFPSHSSSQPFNTWNLWQALAQASYERGRVIREENLSVCKTSKSGDGESNVWFNSPFSLIGGSWEHLSFLCTSIEIPAGSCWWMPLIRLFDRYREIRGAQ